MAIQSNSIFDLQFFHSEKNSLQKITVKLIKPIFYGLGLWILATISLSFIVFGGIHAFGGGCLISEFSTITGESSCVSIATFISPPIRIFIIGVIVTISGVIGWANFEDQRKKAY